MNGENGLRVGIAEEEEAARRHWNPSFKSAGKDPKATVFELKYGEYVNRTTSENLPKSTLVN